MSESFKWSSHVASHGLVFRGILPLMGADSKTIGNMISFGVQVAKKEGICNAGDLVVALRVLNFLQPLHVQYALLKFWLQFSSCTTHGPHVREPPATRPQTRSKAMKPGSTFEGLIAEKTFPQYQSVVERFVRVSVGFGDEDGESNTKTGGAGMERFSYVS
ncbi:unnamed protein product [Brassica oleracea]